MRRFRRSLPADGKPARVRVMPRKPSGPPDKECKTPADQQKQECNSDSDLPKGKRQTMRRVKIRRTDHDSANQAVSCEPRTVSRHSLTQQADKIEKAKQKQRNQHRNCDSFFPIQNTTPFPIPIAVSTASRGSTRKRTSPPSHACRKDT